MIRSTEILKHISWSNLASSIFIVVQSILFFYIAYIIPSEEFGVFALANAVVMIALGIIEQSFSSSIIYNGHTVSDLKAVYRLNLQLTSILILLITLLLVLLIYSKTPSSLPKLILFLCPTLVLSCYNSVALAQLKVNMQFKKIATIELLSTSAYLSILIFFLTLNFSIWSFVIALNIKYCTTLFLLSRKNSFSPITLNLSEDYARSTHWNYGKFIMYEKVTSNIIAQADSFIVSAFLGYNSLGIYELLKRILIRPIVLLYSGVEQVFFTLLSQTKNNNTYNILIHSLFQYSKYLFITGIAIIYLNYELIFNILPKAFALETPTFKSLCLIACVVILLNPIDIILYSKGKSKSFFKWILFYSIPLLLTMTSSIQFGLDIMLLSISVFYIILYVISYPLIIKKLNIPSQLYFEPILFLIIFGTIVFSFKLISEAQTFLNIGLSCLIIIFSLWSLFYKEKRKNAILNL